MPHYLIAESYTGPDQWKALPFTFHEGMGIPVFEVEERAQGFIEANWESLGPGWEPKLLWANQLLYVLERYADEEGVRWVVLDPPPAPVASLAGTHKVDVMEIGDYIDALREFHGL